MRLNVRAVIARLLLPVSLLVAGATSQASEYAWSYYLDAQYGSLLRIGVQPGATDDYGKYDLFLPGMPPSDHAYMMTYHQNGPDWSGPTGFYADDYHSALLGDRTSTTWFDIYLWVQDSWDHGDRITYRVYPYIPSEVPPWYTVRLYLDYVPASAQWTGPREFEISTTAYTQIELPIVAVSNPLDGVRMSFTVAVPEPSSLTALAFGALAVGMLRRRRRRGSD
jgi:hypothetical protein